MTTLLSSLTFESFRRIFNILNLVVKYLLFIKQIRRHSTLQNFSRLVLIVPSRFTLKIAVTYTNPIIIKVSELSPSRHKKLIIHLLIMPKNLMDGFLTLQNNFMSSVPSQCKVWWNSFEVTSLQMRFFGEFLF